MKRHGVIVRATGDLGAAFNPAVAKKDDGCYSLLVRSVPRGYRKTGAVNQFDDNYTSHLSLWEGASPDSFSLVDAGGIKPDRPYDRYGVEDPRITKIGDTYYICYTALSIGLGQPDAGKGMRIALASTRDFRSFTKHGLIGPDSRCKAGILFQSGGGLHFLWKDEEGAERAMISPAPADFGNAEAWKDMWADKSVRHRELLGAQEDLHENHGVEPGAPPIETDEGLLFVYSSISSDMRWTISLMLLDKDDPGRILAKSAGPVLAPLEGYEVSGDVNNVVFPCGALIENGRLYIYYGAADTVCAVASESMENVRKSLRPFRGGHISSNRPPAAS